MASIFYFYDQNTTYLNTIFSLYPSKLNACIQEETFLSIGDSIENNDD